MLNRDLAPVQPALLQPQQGVLVLGYQPSPFLPVVVTAAPAAVPPLDGSGCPVPIGAAHPRAVPVDAPVVILPRYAHPQVGYPIPAGMSSASPVVRVETAPPVAAPAAATAADLWTPQPAGGQVPVGTYQTVPAAAQAPGEAARPAQDRGGESDAEHRTVQRTCPCPHNDWESIRVRRDEQHLRCRQCECLWFVQVHSFTRCARFPSCPQGARCPDVHLHHRKRSLKERKHQVFQRAIQAGHSQQEAEHLASLLPRRPSLGTAPTFTSF
eukprot:TRINITY_DN6932_c2_g1_i1.p1 TRINITY_DN6932_c2_g1~~TRINITY_DN6932_c2_g1_i1.p1  ORF type:complete len:269 (+),score=2.03 TRINITY_DN6932_c2_g1_i1:88-894(+)